MAHNIPLSYRSVFESQTPLRTMHPTSYIRQYAIAICRISD
jgi:hypothetical protein